MLYFITKGKIATAVNNTVNRITILRNYGAWYFDYASAARALRNAIKRSVAA